MLGDWAYGMALRCNDLLFAVRRRLGLPYWSLSAWLKHKVKNAVEYISRFEEIVAREAAKRGVDGVVCGHIHHAEIRMIGDVLYLNDGDWVESCSALVEDASGYMEILRWADPSQRHVPRQWAEGSGSAWPARLRPRLYPRRAKRLEPGPLPGAAAHLKILIVTDAWSPQVNGVVRTLETLGKDLGNLGHTVRYITPLGRRTFPLPTYPEIRLALFQRAALTREIREFAPDAVHIATEGSLGLTARRICLKHGIAFTTAFHTRFAEYVHARFRMVPEKVIWRWLRWFHHPATAVMVATETLRRELAEHGFKHLALWSRGVDVEKFHPIADARLPYEGPLWLYVGRVAVEKNIEAFLGLDMPGTKVVVGDGPAKGELSRKYPAGQIPGRPDRRGADQRLCRQRRLRLSQPHRHVRAGNLGGPGLRADGGGLSGGRSPRCGGARRARGHRCRSAGRGPAHGLSGGAGAGQASPRHHPPGLCRKPFLAVLYPPIPA